MSVYNFIFYIECIPGKRELPFSLDTRNQIFCLHTSYAWEEKNDKMPSHSRYFNLGFPLSSVKYWFMLHMTLGPSPCAQKTGKRALWKDFSGSHFHPRMARSTLPNLYMSMNHMPLLR